VTTSNTSEAAKAVVRRNTEEVQGGGNFAVFDELFADDFLDHTPQPGRTPDKAGARELYKVLRAAFPDFHAEIHWQLADGDRVTTYKTYHGTHWENSSVWRRQAERFNSRPSMSCACATARSPSIGASPISSR
jgi:SnoaL-like polyketide cyclase